MRAKALLIVLVVAAAAVALARCRNVSGSLLLLLDDQYDQLVKTILTRMNQLTEHSLLPTTGYRPRIPPPPPVQGV